MKYKIYKNIKSVFGLQCLDRLLKVVNIKDKFQVHT